MIIELFGGPYDGVIISVEHTPAVLVLNNEQPYEITQCKEHPSIARGTLICKGEK